MDVQIEDRTSRESEAVWDAAEKIGSLTAKAVKVMLNAGREPDEVFALTQQVAGSLRVIKGKLERNIRLAGAGGPGGSPGPAR